MTATSFVSQPVRSLFAVFALCALVLGGVTPRPASADGAASTRNIILGAAAVAAGIIIYNNVAHKHAAANQVVGYTRDGGVVHADGRVTYPNGRTLYTSNGDGRVCGYGYGEPCYGTPVAYRRQGDDDDRYRPRRHHRHAHRWHADGDEGEQRGDDGE